MFAAWQNFCNARSCKNPMENYYIMWLSWSVLSICDHMTADMKSGNEIGSLPTPRLIANRTHAHTHINCAYNTFALFVHYYASPSRSTMLGDVISTNEIICCFRCSGHAHQASLGQAKCQKRTLRRPFPKPPAPNQGLRRSVRAPTWITRSVGSRHSTRGHRMRRWSRAKSPRQVSFTLATSWRCAASAATGRCPNGTTTTRY